MHLFSHKLNPFCSSSVNLGPVYMERLFECLLIKRGQLDIRFLQHSDKLKLFLQYLKDHTAKARQGEKRFVSFYFAYFLQQWIRWSAESPACGPIRLEAMGHYRHYLKSAEESEESRYYSQWQIGLLSDQLHYPWQTVQKELLQAGAIDPTRGEGIREIIAHYVSLQDWENAYVFSSYACLHHFDKNPIATRRWFVDWVSYSWRVLEMHCVICCRLNYREEAENSYQQLIAWLIANPTEFDQLEIKQVHALRELFQCRENNYQLSVTRLVPIARK